MDQFLQVLIRFRVPSTTITALMNDDPDPPYFEGISIPINYVNLYLPHKKTNPLIYQNPFFPLHPFLKQEV